MKLIDDEEVEMYTGTDWTVVLVSIAVAIIFVWIVIDKIVGADRIISLFE